MLEKVTLKNKKLEDYYALIEDSEKERLEELFSYLKDKRIIHVNSAVKGGGVAGILSSLVPLLKEGGVDCDWYSMQAQEEFFAITKKIHNLVQGDEITLSEQEKENYFKVSQQLAAELKRKDFDLLVLHDPQPLGAITFLESEQAISRMHLDTSNFQRKKASRLYDSLENFQRIVFSSERLMLEDIKTQKDIIPPAIDPFSDINKPLESSPQAIEELGLDINSPLISQISRFDKFKDPQGVVEIYKKVKKRIPDLQLILFGINRAQDDPEQKRVFKEVQQKAEGISDIHLFFHLESIEELSYSEKELVNAIQRESDVILQNSYEEAFGLTVSEAMWKQTPVVGGVGGGVKQQVKNGKTGYIIQNYKQGAEKVISLLQNTRKQNNMGAKAKQEVRNNYLITRLLKDHLSLYNDLMN